VAPALHSLIISERTDVERIVGSLCDSHVDLRKLILKDCYFGKNGTGILTKIVTLYPDLEALSLHNCHQLTSAAYSLIPRLKKLSELNLSYDEVSYLYVKLLQPIVYICEHK
jgi:Ran GTPase-activating protein (RanGAP) involved in mRNA processing and transport